MEYAFIDNMIFDYLILVISQKIVKKTVSFRRNFLACLVGTLFAMFLPILSLHPLIMIALKLIIGVIICHIAFNSQTLKEALKNFFSFIFVTACLGGLCYMILNLLGGKISNSLSFSYNYPVPVGLILLAVMILVYVLNQLINMLTKQRKINNFVYKIKFINGSKQLETTGFLDSGNTLIDPVTLKPVIIVTYPIFNEFFSVPLDKIISRKVTSSDLKNGHYINFNTLNKKSNQMLVFEIEQMEVENENIVQTFSNVIVGLSFTKLNKSLNCKALLNPNLIC